jgi:hypothetical protein
VDPGIGFSKMVEDNARCGLAQGCLIRRPQTTLTASRGWLERRAKVSSTEFSCNLVDLRTTQRKSGPGTNVYECDCYRLCGSERG